MALTTVWAIISPEAFPELFQILQDDSEFPRTYQEWQQQSERTKRRAQSEGRTVFEVSIEPTAFVRYCAASGQPPSFAM